MSGGLLHSFKEGNRSEILADYLLSSIGITTPVRRQDDHGFDFYCQIADNESGYLTFGYPFMIQIKSKATNNCIVYGEKEDWKSENISWLFKNEIPFLIGIVDKRKFSIELFDTSGLWQVYNINHQNCSTIEMCPNAHPKGEMRNNCELIKLEDWSEGKGDGFKYKIDLGNPLISINNKDVLEIANLIERKNILRRIIEIEQLNILYRKQHVRAFTEIKENITNASDFITGAKFEGRTTDNVDDIYASIREALIVQLFTLNLMGRKDEVQKIKELLRHIPYAYYYKQFLNQTTEDLFDWIDLNKIG
jgi:hypothetical protein